MNTPLRAPPTPEALPDNSPVYQYLNALSTLAQNCERSKSREAAEQACMGTRNVWMAIHQQVLKNPLSITEEICVHAESGIQACLTAIDGSRFDQDLLEKMKKNMSLRLALVTLLRKNGLPSVNQRLQKELVG